MGGKRRPDFLLKSLGARARLGMSLTTSAQGLLLTGGTALTIGILHPCHFMHNNSSQGRLDQRESVTFERQLIFICVVLTIEALNETSLVERQI